MSMVFVAFQHINLAYNNVQVAVNIGKNISHILTNNSHGEIFVESLVVILVPIGSN